MRSFRNQTNARAGFVLLLWTLLACPTSLAQEVWRVGDDIRFEFMRKQLTGKVSRVLPGGSYRVEIDPKGDRFLPPWTIVRGENILGKAGESQPPSADVPPTEPDRPAASPLPVRPVRTWKDKSGKFEMQGKFVDLVDGELTLERTDGTKLTLPLDRLDPADIEVAEAYRFEMENENPFDASGGGEQNPFLNETKAADADETPSPFLVKEMDFSATRMKTATLAPDWRLEIGPSSEIENSLPERLYPVPESGRRQIVIDSRTPGRIFIGNRKLREKVEEGYVIDLASGKTLGPFTYPLQNVTTIAFDSRTNQLVTATTTGESRRPRTVDIWRIEGNNVEHKFGFVPTNSRIVMPVQNGVFLDDNRLLLTIFGKAGIYDLEALKAEAGFQFFNASTVEIGPGGKYLLGRVDDKTVVFDVEQQESVATLDRLLTINRNFGFNADMTRGAFTESQRLTIWDLEKGQLVHEVILPMQVIVGTTPIFLDDENVLLARQSSATLVNLRLKSPTWSYRGAKFSAVPGTSRLLTVGEKDGVGAVAGLVELPSPRAQTLISSLSLSDLIVMPTGTAVAIRQGGVSGTSLQNIREQLVAHGYPVVSDSPFEFRATVTKGEKSTRTYRDVTGGADETVTMQSESYELALYHEEEKIWYRSGGSGSNDPGMFVQLDQGESVQSRINQGKGSPDGFFSGLLLPELFLKTPPGFVLGTTAGLSEWD